MVVCGLVRSSSQGGVAWLLVNPASCSEVEAIRQGKRITSLDELAEVFWKRGQPQSHKAVSSKIKLKCERSFRW